MWFLSFRGVKELHSITGDATNVRGGAEDILRVTNAFRVDEHLEINVGKDRQPNEEENICDCLFRILSRSSLFYHVMIPFYG